MINLIPIIIISFLLIEVILQLSWIKLYFKYGIPVYKKKYPFFGSLKDPFDTTYLENHFKTGQTCTIFFRRFNEFECGFREKLWEIKLFNYVPVMRGVIRGDENSKSFQIIGYLNWYILLFATFVFISAALGPAPPWGAILILVFAMYLIQIFRFNSIAEVAFEWLKNNK